MLKMLIPLVCNIENKNIRVHKDMSCAKKLRKRLGKRKILV